ncbi:YkgJ family cysteine cluster protein, partial [Dissulfurirhabdus thermomarina]|nr:YkgJ family cysteine cluster protein [Dissulfurirhabdus thermomarina]
MGAEPARLPCQLCPEPCCPAVKRLPYAGETHPVLFGRLLLGAFPDVEAPGPWPVPRRPFVVEWVVPGEAGACPAFTSEGLCGVHPVRPAACRRFPRTRFGLFHPRCPLGAAVRGEAVAEPRFLHRQAALDAHLLNLSAREGAGAMAAFLGEAAPDRMPLLYNGYWLAAVLLAGVDLQAALAGQEAVLEAYREAGFAELTFLVPDTDFEAGGPVDGCLANLRWLRLRVEEGLA